MSNTLRKDKNGNIFKEGLKSHERRYRCRCEYCTTLERNKLVDKIAEKELKEEVRTVEKGEHLDFDMPEQENIIEQIMGRI